MALLRQTQETRLREKAGERGPLSCDSAFHQGTGRGRHKTRHASPSSLPSTPLSVPILPALPSYPTSVPPLHQTTSNFYQERSCWNSFYASVLCKEAQVHTNVHTQCHRAIGFKYCVAVLGLSLFFAKETCLETLMPRDRNTCLYTHSLVPLASLLYLLSLGPIHLTFH